MLADLIAAAPLPPDTDLTGADLRGAYLRGADLTGADLTGAQRDCAAARGATT